MDVEQVEQTDDYILEILIMLDKLTDDGFHSEDRTRLGELIHERFGSWEEFDKQAYGKEA